MYHGCFKDHFLCTLGWLCMDALGKVLMLEALPVPPLPPEPVEAPLDAGPSSPKSRPAPWPLDSLIFCMYMYIRHIRIYLYACM